MNAPIRRQLDVYEMKPSGLRYLIFKRFLYFWLVEYDDNLLDTVVSPRELYDE